MNPWCYILLVVCELATPLGCDKGAFSYSVTSSSSCCPDPLYNVDVGSTVPAVNYALDYVNVQPDLLPGLNLTYGDVNFAGCPLTGMQLDDLLSIHNYAILGYSCTEHAQMDAFTGLLSNFTPTVTYTPTSAAALLVYPESSSEQPVLFSLHPSPDTYATSVLTLAREFGWQWLVVLTEGAAFFEEVLQSLVNLSPLFNVTIFQPDNSVIPEYLHITFLNMNSTAASRHLCEFSSAGRVFPSSVWITYGGNFSLSSSSSCNSTQLLDAYDGLITVQSDPRRTTIEDTSNTIMELEMMLQRVSSIVASYPLSYYAVDAVLVLAQAVNDTLAGWSNNSPDWSFCEREESTKDASISKCFVKQKLLSIVMQGLTGPISFNSRGEREQHVLGLSQLRKTGEDIDSILVGIIQVNGTENTSDFQFLQNESESTLFRGPTPNATSMIKYISKYPLALFVVGSVVASLGNVFCIVCLLFNIIFRKRKIVRLISPNLNYFVILGAFLLYSSVYFRVYPSTSQLYISVRCNLQAFLTCVGYVLCFAPVLMKMFRVAYIFRNPTHKKKAVKDWHLFLLTFILVGIITAAVVLSFVVPIFRPNPHLIEDLENPPRITEDGLELFSCVYQCYDSVSLVWVSLEYVYLFLLQVVAFVLAIATCRVKIKVLNDSKEMLVIIYSTTMVLIVLGLITFVLPTHLVINEVLFSFGIMLVTTILLGLLFIPKMVDLYRDPRGEGIFGHYTTQAQSQYVPTTNFTQESIQNGNPVVLISKSNGNSLSNSVLLAST